MNVVVIKDRDYDVFTIAVETQFEDRYLPLISFFHRRDFEKFVDSCHHVLETSNAGKPGPEAPAAVKRFIGRLKRIDGIK